MKKIISIVCAAAICLFVSCNNNKTASSGMSDKAKKNMETNRAVIKMFETGDMSKLADYIAADAVDHSGPKGEVKGIDSIKAMFEYFVSTMSNTKIEIVKELADDDYVMSWIKQSWIAKVDDPMMNMKAGQTGTMESIETTKYNTDGKVTDHWGFISMGDMMNMMQPPPPPVLDTIKNKMK